MLRISGGVQRRDADAFLMLLPDRSGDWCEPGVRGEPAAVFEPGWVTDFGDGSCAGPGPDPAQGYQDLSEPTALGMR
jgi:hypothetical protein